MSTTRCWRCLGKGSLGTLPGGAALICRLCRGTGRRQPPALWVRVKRWWERFKERHVVADDPWEHRWSHALRIRSIVREGFWEPEGTHVIVRDNGPSMPMDERGPFPTMTEAVLEAARLNALEQWKAEHPASVT